VLGAVYMVGMALITVIATHFAPETFREDFGETRPKEQRFVQKAKADREREPEPVA
jgi:hypothetical protein